VRARVGSIVAAAALVLWPVVAGAAPGATALWARSVTVVSDSPLAPRDDPAVVAMGERVLVAPGGRTGEGVMAPDEHRDGAILDLVTKRWRPIAPAPFALESASGVWTGPAVVVLGIRPNCTFITGSGVAGTGCPTGTLAAAVYTVATNRWRAITLPQRYLEPNRWFPTALHWTGDEALFSLGDAGIAIRPADGNVRPVDVPRALPSAGACDTGANFVTVALQHPDPANVRFTPSVLGRSGRRTTAGPAYDVAASGSPWNVACTAKVAFVASGDGTVVERYDLAARRWSRVGSLPAATPCVIGAPVCDQYRYSGHGAVLDAWIPGQTDAHRLGGGHPGWRAVAGGPGLDTSIAMTWAGGLGITTHFDPATGGDTGELAVWRPL
jgi:hypothetical protein